MVGSEATHTDTKQRHGQATHCSCFVVAVAVVVVTKRRQEGLGLIVTGSDREVPKSTEIKRERER